MSEKYYLTKEGLEELKREFKELVEARRPELAKRLKDAAAFGDLTENSEYAEAKEMQGFIEGRIQELRGIINNAEIISTGRQAKRVAIGSTVKVKVLNLNKIEKFTIVGPQEAAPEEQRISHESPLGKAFLGRKAGDGVEVETPRGKARYKILSI